MDQVWLLIQAGAGGQIPPLSSLICIQVATVLFITPIGSLYTRKASLLIEFTSDSVQVTWMET